MYSLVCWWIFISESLYKRLKYMAILNQHLNNYIGSQLGAI